MASPSARVHERGLEHRAIIESDMRRGFAVFSLAGALIGTAVLFGQGPEPPRSAAAGLGEIAAPFVAEHCAVCHGAELSTVGLDLEALVQTLEDEPRLDTWARIAGKIRGGQMPPPGRPRPSAESLESVSASIGAYLVDAGYVRTEVPGRVTARRLNRVEYDNTVRSLLGVHADPADDFPIDDAGYGFDNNGDVLSVSPLLMEKHMAAARRLSRLAVVGRSAPEEPTLLARYTGKRSHDAEGTLTAAGILPYSMRGSLYGTHLFSWDADYEIRFRAANYRYSRQQLIARGDIEPEERDIRDRDEEYGLTEKERRTRFLEDARQNQPPVPVVVTLDGDVIQEELIEGSNAFGYDRGEFSTRVHVSAGEHAFRLSYPHNANLDDPRENVMADGRRVLYVDYLDIVGPFNPSPDPPASYEQLFICRHRPGEHDESCAGQVVTSLARRAYRRPVTGTEVEALVGLVRQAEAAGDSFEAGVQLAAQAVLLSPHFLFRIEGDTTGTDPYVLNDHELALRLSYFLWADMPDPELFGLADDGGADRGASDVTTPNSGADGSPSTGDLDSHRVDPQRWSGTW